jgi:type II secretory ATPase GspE/PulE/Tfp pilus assembly ATPase PilB-like protein
VQVDEKKGFTFARGLRAALRQDPDVILVGEIRDLETAELAVRAALTGHLVLATLHTLDAASSVTRLVDMGVPAYLVAASARLVLAQRLLRRPCPACTTDVPLEPSTAVLLGLPPGATVAEGRGCQECSGSGHRGRIAIFESLVLSRAVRDAVVAGADAEGLRVAAGSPPGLLERAALAAQDGRVSGREALRVAGSDESM